MVLLERYIRGEYETVWAEMVAGTDRDGSPIPLVEAEAVAQETMQRVRYNAEILVQRLKEMEYDWSHYPDGEPLSPFGPPLGQPAPDVDEQIALLEERAGAVPLSLRFFWKVVGHLDFMGSLPGYLNIDDWDPLVVYPPEAALTELEDWEYWAEENTDKQPEFLFAVPIAPDDLHKNNTSGGSPYEIVLPNPGADAVLENELRNTTFVNYLRISFRWGGFPNFETTDPAPPFMTQLTAGLLPI